MLPFILLFILLPLTAPAGLVVPVIRLNSARLEVPEVVLLAGTPFSLSCEGQGNTFWRTRLRPPRIHISKNVLTVKHSTAENTGTYMCAYESQRDLFSEVHIYVKDSAKAFTTPLDTEIVKKEGESCWVDCLPTDPTATEFSLRSADGSPLPPEMNYTTDPKKGIQIWNLQHGYTGEYVCSVNNKETQQDSTSFFLTVNKHVRSPPSVSFEMDEYVQMVGEKLQIRCFITNPDIAYIITWQHSSKQLPDAVNSMNMSSDLIYIRSVLTLTEVDVSYTGNLTCTGRNTAGINSSTASLRVVDGPFARLDAMLKLGGRWLGAEAVVEEGGLLELNVQIDAHPPVQQKWWETPRGLNTSFHFHRIHRSYRYEASLSLRGVRADEGGWYKFYATSSSAQVSTNFKIFVLQKPSVVVKWRNGSLTCIASGYPKPSVWWQQCAEVQTVADGCKRNRSSTVERPSTQSMLEPMDEFRPVVESVLLKQKITNNMTVECVAINIAGEGSDTFSVGELYVSPSEDWIFTLLCGASLVITLLLVMLGICIYRCKQKPRYEIRWKIIEANEGNNYTYIDPNQLPYNNIKWEFPRDRLMLGQVLGAGAFGKVVEATAYGLEKEEHITRVAVKMLKSSAHSEEKEALMSELKILSHLGPHANIVNLLGACTQGGPVLLITEYCSHGDLLNFLRRQAELFLNSVLQERDFSNIYKNLCAQGSQLRRHITNSYQDVPAPRDCSQKSCSGGEKDLRTLDMNDLIRFSVEVAKGMDFLASKNCIHRDVAARNVLVTDCFVAKICDFGLARDIMNDSNYVVRGNARLPVKWMSPESIFECIYTVQSDVWSYGILLWEIFSLGRSPYPDVAVDARFYKMIKVGYHMAQPDFATAEMYTIMKTCWSLEPTSRPTFGKIVHLIAKLLPESSDQQYKNMQQELQQQLPSEQWVSPKACEDPHHETSVEDEQQLLMQLNNYQLY